MPYSETIKKTLELSSFPARPVLLWVEGHEGEHKTFSKQNIKHL